MTQTCINCGILFSVPDEWDRERRVDKRVFYCPNGHEQCYTRGTVQILEDKLRAAQAEKDATERRLQSQLNEVRHAQLVAERERDKERRKRRRIEARISKGVCPCCNRTFENLQKHMATKHKDYALPPATPKQIEGTIQ